jgi:hypothetical protein
MGGLRVQETKVAKSASIISGPLLLRLVSMWSGFGLLSGANGSNALPVWIERGRNPRRLDIEPEVSDNSSASPTIVDNFNGTFSSILPSAAIPFSWCEGFFLSDNESLLAIVRNVRGEDVSSLFAMSFSTSEKVGVLGVAGKLETVI